MTNGAIPQQSPTANDVYGIFAGDIDQLAGVIAYLGTTDRATSGHATRQSGTHHPLDDHLRRVPVLIKPNKFANASLDHRWGDLNFLTRFGRERCPVRHTSYL